MKKKNKLEEEEIRHCIELSKTWLEENLSIIYVNVLRRTLEKPPVWWQWISILLMGVLAGVGLGVFIGIQFGPRQIEIVPIEKYIGAGQ